MAQQPLVALVLEPPLQLVGVSALVNVALDLVLVGPAGLGVVGAAWATVVAQSVAAVGALVVVRRRFPGGRLAGAFSRSGDVPVGASVIEVLRVGVPSAVQMAVVNLSYALVTGLLNRYGTDVAAAAGVGLQISTIAGMTSVCGLLATGIGGNHDRSEEHTSELQSQR